MRFDLTTGRAALIEAMHWLTSLFLGLVLLAGCAGSGSDGARQPDAPPAAADSVFEPEEPPTYRTSGGLRLATLNTEFMFDGQGNEGGASFPHQGDTAKAQAHRNEIADVLQEIGADVVMLQEVENRGVVEALARSRPLGGMGYKAYFVQGEDTFTGQDVALLSRVPVDTVGRTDVRARVGTTRDDYGVSKNMFARLRLGGVPTTLIGVHFLARPDDTERKPRREAQAEVIARLAAREYDRGRAVAVMGDFNDYDGETMDARGHRPITNVLAQVKEAGEGADDDLRNVMAEVPQADRFTAHWDRNDDGVATHGEMSALDHILLSSRLYRRLSKVTFAQAHDPLAVTDHFPIIVTLGAD
jgi:endonuclease/exonuclease/phosphatase family metal-dependent hydrolase